MIVSDLEARAGRHSIRIDALTYLAKEAEAAVIGKTKPNIFECGSGLSTVALARAANKHDGHVFSLEHSPTYAIETEKLLIEFRVAHRVSLVLSPLVPTQWGLWYRDFPPIEYAFAFIDGPPLVSIRRRAAMHLLDPHIRGPVVVDDGIEMRATIEDWCTLGWRAEYLDLGRGGMAKLTR